MLTGARCERCDHALPLKGRSRDFGPPPSSVACPGCGHDCGAILPYRVGWMEALLFKLGLLVSVPASAAAALWGGLAPWQSWLLLLLGPIVGGGLGGFLVSRLLGLPLTLLHDALRRRG